MHCDTEIVILIGTSEYIFKMLLENGIGYKKPPVMRWLFVCQKLFQSPDSYYKN